MENLNVFVQDVLNTKIINKINIIQKSRENNYQDKVVITLEEKFSLLNFSQNDLTKLKIILSNNDLSDLAEINKLIYLDVVQRKMTNFISVKNDTYIHNIVIALLYHLLPTQAVLQDDNFVNMTTQGQIAYINSMLIKSNEVNKAIPAKVKVYTFNLSTYEFENEVDVVRYVAWIDNIENKKLAILSEHLNYHYNIKHYHVNMDFDSFYRLQLYNLKRTWIASASINSGIIDDNSRVNYMMRIVSSRVLSSQQVSRLNTLLMAALVDVTLTKNELMSLTLDQVDFMVQEIKCKLPRTKNVNIIPISQKQCDTLKMLNQDIFNYKVLTTVSVDLKIDRVTTGVRLISMLPLGSNIDVNTINKFITRKHYQKRSLVTTIDESSSVVKSSDLVLKFVNDEDYYLNLELFTNFRKIYDKYFVGASPIKSVFIQTYLSNVMNKSNNAVMFDSDIEKLRAVFIKPNDYNQPFDSTFLFSIGVCRFLELVMNSSVEINGSKIVLVNYDVSDFMKSVVGDLVEFRTYATKSKYAGTLCDGYRSIDPGNLLTIINLSNDYYKKEDFKNIITSDLSGILVLYLSKDIMTVLADVLQMREDVYVSTSLPLVDGVQDAIIRLSIALFEFPGSVKLTADVIGTIVGEAVNMISTTVKSLPTLSNIDRLPDLIEMGENYCATYEAVVPFQVLSTVVSAFSSVMDYVAVSKIDDQNNRVIGTTSRSKMEVARRKGSYRMIEGLSNANFLTTSRKNVFDRSDAPLISPQEIVTKAGHYKIYFDRLNTRKTLAYPLNDVGAANATNLFMTKSKYTLIDSLDYFSYEGIDLSVIRESVNLNAVRTKYGVGDTIAFNSIYFTSDLRTLKDGVATVVDKIVHHIGAKSENELGTYYFNIPVVDDSNVGILSKYFIVRKVVDRGYQIKLGSYDFIDTITNDELTSILKYLKDESGYNPTVLNLSMHDCINSISNEGRSFDVNNLLIAISLSRCLPLVRCV